MAKLQLHFFNNKVNDHFPNNLKCLCNCCDIHFPVLYKYKKGYISYKEKRDKTLSINNLTKITKMERYYLKPNVKQEKHVNKVSLEESKKVYPLECVSTLMSTMAPTIENKRKIESLLTNTYGSKIEKNFLTKVDKGLKSDDSIVVDLVTSYDEIFQISTKSMCEKLLYGNNDIVFHGDFTNADELHNVTCIHLITYGRNYYTKIVTVRYNKYFNQKWDWIMAYGSDSEITRKVYRYILPDNFRINYSLFLSMCNSMIIEDEVNVPEGIKWILLSKVYV